MERDDYLWKYPIQDSPDSPSPPLPDSPPPPRPPSPEGDPPSPESFSTPEILFEWATEKLLNLRNGLFNLLGSFGFLQEETLAKFEKVERCEGTNAIRDTVFHQLWPSREPSTGSGLNVASTSRALSSMGESSLTFGSNVPSTSQASSWMGESSMTFDPNVASTSRPSSLTGESSMTFGSNVPSSSSSQASSWAGEYSLAFGSNVQSTSQASSLMGESSMEFELTFPTVSQASSSMGESSMEFESTVPTTSQASSWMGESSMAYGSNVPSTSIASSRKRKYPTSTTNPSTDHDAAIHIGMDFVLRSDPLLKGIQDFCAKFLKHNEVSEQVRDTFIAIEKSFARKGKRKMKNYPGGTDVKKYMHLQVGVRELQHLAIKIATVQNVLCNKLCYIMKRKRHLDQFFRGGQNLSLIAQKDRFSYSMYWIYKNLVVVNNIMEKKKVLHFAFEAVRSKVQKQLDDY